MSHPRRRFAALALLAALSVPAAWGRPPQPRNGGAPPTPSARLLALFSAWLGRTLPADWLKGSCMIDPFGQCLPGATPSGAAPSTQADNSCMIDPAGHCAPGH